MLEAAKVSALLDAIVGRNGLIPAINAARVGLVGGSFGGAVAAQLMRIDPRVVVGINFDGWQFGPDAGLPFSKPFLFFNSVEAFYTDSDVTGAEGVRNTALLNAREDGWQIEQARANPETRRLLLAESRHADFSDAILSWVREGRRWINWEERVIGPGDGRRAVDAIVLAFFDRTLGYSDAAVFDGILATHPQVRDIGSTSLRTLQKR